MISAEEYLKLFENNIIIKGVENKILKPNKAMIPVKNGKLDSSEFGRFLGNKFEYNKPLAIDYYGLLKKSTGFDEACCKYCEVEIIRMKTDIIHFASIKIEDMSELDKDLIVDFPAFKS